MLLLFVPILWMTNCHNGIPTVQPRQRMRICHSSILTAVLFFCSSLRVDSLHIPNGVLITPPPTMAYSRTSTALAAVSSSVNDLKVAIIGAGAAGLATARVFSRNGYTPQVFDAAPSLGGVWNYKQTAAPVEKMDVGPMYKGLRTNLPRELMQYREFEWGNDGKEPSFVTHEMVQSYLTDYTNHFNLTPLIQFNSKVTQVTMETTSEHDESEEVLTPISIAWEHESSRHKETFDVVCVCNGHYALPSIPHIPGLDENFNGRSMHSKYYDTPQDFTDQTVLCIGGRASGADLSREISAYAKKVYLSDSTCPIEKGEKGLAHDNIVWVPKTVAVESGSKIVFDNECIDCPRDVDTIVYCTGYDYQFPFFNERSNVDLAFVTGERRVTPLFEQMWHARHTNLAFLGLPHSVVPFPLFELQAEAIVAQIKIQRSGDGDGSSEETGGRTLPGLQERLEASQEDAKSGGPNTPGRLQDTHFLGSHQWKFLQLYAEYANVWDESLERYVKVNELLYNHSGSQRKGSPPGGLDEYRYNSYVRDDDNVSFQVKSFLEGKITNDVDSLTSSVPSLS